MRFLDVDRPRAASSESGATRRFVCLGLLVALLLMLTQSVQRRDDGGQACQQFAAALATRHARRRRRHTLLPELLAVTEQGVAQSDAEEQKIASTLQEARCLLLLRSDPQLSHALATAEAIHLHDSKVAHGRRLLLVRRQRASGSGPGRTSRRVTRGLGVFAGDDFSCEQRDAFVGAPWARGACLIKCAPGSNAGAPHCPRAIAVCEAQPECTTVDINVEGSVATLKRETELSRRTSRVKDVVVRHMRRSAAHPRGSGMQSVDGPCAQHEVLRLPGVPLLCEPSISPSPPPSP